MNVNLFIFKNKTKLREVDAFLNSPLYIEASDTHTHNWPQRLFCWVLKKPPKKHKNIARRALFCLLNTPPSPQELHQKNMKSISWIRSIYTHLVGKPVWAQFSSFLCDDLLLRLSLTLFRSDSDTRAPPGGLPVTFFTGDGLTLLLSTFLSCTFLMSARVMTAGFLLLDVTCWMDSKIIMNDS